MKDSITFESTKEEVAEYFAKLCKFGDDVKKNFIENDISGEILLDLNDSDFKKLKAKLGHIKKIQKIIEENKEKLVRKEIKEVISIYSTSEQVAEFFEMSLNFKGDLQNLNGEELLELTEEKIEALGLNLGQKKKLIKFIKYFKTLKIEPPKEIEIKITKESTEEEVAKFLKVKLGFSDKAIEALALDGDGLLSLKEEEIKSEETLSQEEKDKLLDILIGEKKEGKEIPDIKITRESTEEEVAKFLKVKLGFSDKAIEALALDGDGLLSLKEEEIKSEENLSQEEKDKLFTFLKEQEIKITEESSEDDVKKFLEIKLKFSKKSAESLGPDGQGLLSLKEEEIKNEENLSQEEKDKLNNYLIENNYLKPEPKPQPEPVKVPEEKVIKITKESSKEEVAKYLKEVCKITEKNIKLLNLDGKTIFKLTKDKIEQYKDLSKEEKETILKFLVDNNVEIELESEKDIVLTKQSSKEEVAKYLKIKLKFSEKAVKSLSLNGETLFKLEENKIKKNNNLNDEEKKKLIKLIGDNSIKYGGIEGKNIQIYDFKKYNISPLINDSNYNIFCIFSFYENEIKHVGISVYDDKREYIKLKFSGYVSYQPFIINDLLLLIQMMIKLKLF